jgi:SAM-dependent MidA family methyltransferase
LTIADLVRERGPMTVAAFMDLALYDSDLGYYARAAQRSGRAGDFFTSVDVGPLFGELLEIQLAEMAELLEHGGGRGPRFPFDLVEAGAGNGRLSADVLRAARDRDPALYDRICLHLVEASALARAAQQHTLGDAANRLVSSSLTLPSSFEGVLIANELLDALPVHQVVMRVDGLREVYVESGCHEDGGLVTSVGPPSTPALAAYLARLGVSLEPGWQMEIGLRAVEWVRNAARCLRRGFIILIDYGHEARERYSVTHAGGTLTSFSRHTVSDCAAGTPGWLDRPGEQDLTAHVDFTSVRRAAEDEGCVALGFLDQTYFLLGLLTGGRESLPFGSDSPRPSSLGELKQRLALKTLLMPGNLGSTHKVLILGKNVGLPALRACSFRQRVT